MATVVSSAVESGLVASLTVELDALREENKDRGRENAEMAAEETRLRAEVAAHADAHYRVRKIVDGSDTTSTIEKLDQKQCVEELARMLGGATITETTLRHAFEMFQLARSR